MASVDRDRKVARLPGPLQLAGKGGDAKLGPYNLSEWIARIHEVYVYCDHRIRCDGGEYPTNEGGQTVVRDPSKEDDPPLDVDEDLPYEAFSDSGVFTPKEVKMLDTWFPPDGITDTITIGGVIRSICEFYDLLIPHGAEDDLHLWFCAPRTVSVTQPRSRKRSLGANRAGKTPVPPVEGDAAPPTTNAPKRVRT